MSIENDRIFNQRTAATTKKSLSALDLEWKIVFRFGCRIFLCF
jgi:hypothetical protein